MKRPRGIRSNASAMLDAAGLLDRLLWLRARTGRRGLTVVTYHRVGRPEAVGELDPGLFEVEPTQLEEQLEVLRDRCTLVSICDVRRFVRGQRPPPNPVLVTFDDGYVEGHSVALPILRRAGVPATFFIPTAFPDAGRLFWWDKVWLILRRCQREVVELDYPIRLTVSCAEGPVTMGPRAAPYPARAARLVCQAIKRTPGVELGRLWEALEMATGVTLHPAEERAIARRTIMGWSEVRALRDAGLDIQSHSHEHLVLNTLTPQATRRDLERSAEALRDANLGEIFGVAYPVGYALPPPLRRATEAARFELGFTNGTGLGSPPPLDPLDLPRISTDIEMLLADYKLALLVGTPGRGAGIAPTGS